jgi:hypothetical protein
VPRSSDAQRRTGPVTWPERETSRIIRALVNSWAREPTFQARLLELAGLAASARVSYGEEFWRLRQRAQGDREARAYADAVVAFVRAEQLDRVAAAAEFGAAYPMEIEEIVHEWCIARVRDEREPVEHFGMAFSEMTPDLSVVFRWDPVYESKADALARIEHEMDEKLKEAEPLQAKVVGKRGRGAQRKRFEVSTRNLGRDVRWLYMKVRHGYGPDRIAKAEGAESKTVRDALDRLLGVFSPATRAAWRGAVGRPRKGQK